MTTQELDQRARDVLDKNDHGGYTVPREKLYPFQWNWDSCLVALGFSTYNEARAWQELETLFSGQWDNGMVPHIVFHREKTSTYCPGPAHWQAKNEQGEDTSGISNPPIAAHVIRQLLEEAKDKDLAREKAQSLFPKVFRWHKWWHDKRDPQGKGLVVSYHPWETGRDNSHDWRQLLAEVPLDKLEPYERKDIEFVPADERPNQKEYDAFMALVQLGRKCDYDDDYLYEHSPFKVADTTVNFILARADRDLLWVANQLGKDRYSDEITALEGWIPKTRAALVRLWNKEEESYQPISFANGYDNRHVGGTSSAAFLAFLPGCDNDKKAHALLAKLEHWSATHLLVPSYDPHHEDYDALRYWKGPVWAIMNYMIYKGLRTSGHHRAGLQLAADTAALMESGGFAEYYNPDNGDPLGGNQFSWTAAMWLYWLSPMRDELRANYPHRWEALSAR